MSLTWFLKVEVINWSKRKSLESTEHLNEWPESGDSLIPTMLGSCGGGELVLYLLEVEPSGSVKVRS